MMIALAIIGIAALLFLAAIGLFTLAHLLRPKRSPADTSNRINHIRLWWFVLTREDKFVNTFTWLTRDEWENINNATRKDI